MKFYQLNGTEDIAAYLDTIDGYCHIWIIGGNHTSIDSNTFNTNWSYIGDIPDNLLTGKIISDIKK